MKTRSGLFGILLFTPFFITTLQSINSAAKAVSEIIIDKLSVDISLTDKQKDSIYVLFDRAQIKAQSMDVKDSVFAKEIKLTRQMVMDSILTHEQLQIVKSKEVVRQQEFIEKVKMDYKSKK